MTTHISPTPCVIVPRWFSTAKPISVLLFNVLSISLFVSVLTILCLFCFHFPLCHPPFSVSLFVSLQHRVQRWPTLSNRLMLASNTTQVICLSYLPSLAPSVPFPLPSPFLFATSVDTMTGRDSWMTSQFPPGLGYFTLGFQKDFQLTWLYTHKKILIPKVHRELRIGTCHSLLNERWNRPLITTAFCLTSALINTV